MIVTNEWLPIGSVVHVDGAQGLYFIIGYMQKTADERVWDYGARQYPMGYTTDDEDIYFDRDMIDGIYALGYQDMDGDQWQNYLKSLEPAYAKLKGESVGQAS